MNIKINDLEINKLTAGGYVISINGLPGPVFETIAAAVEWINYRLTTDNYLLEV